MKQNEKEKASARRSMVQQMMDEHGDLDETKKKFLCKPLYQMAAELQNENCAPSLNSYGGSDVYLRYKKNKWFENVNIIALKRLKEW